MTSSQPSLGDKPSRMPPADLASAFGGKSRSDGLGGRLTPMRLAPTAPAEEPPAKVEPAESKPVKASAPRQAKPAPPTGWTKRPALRGAQRSGQLGPAADRGVRQRVNS